MRKLMKTLTLLAISAAMAFPAQAAFEQTGNKEVKVSGEGMTPGTMVTLQVLKEGVSPEDLLSLSPAEYLSVLVCHDQSVVNNSGKYSFTFNIGGGSGNYTAYTSFEGEGSATDETLFFVDIEDVTPLLTALNDADCATSAEIANEGEIAVEDIISDSSKLEILGFTSEEGEGINKTALSKILYDYIKTNPFDVEDRNGAIKKYEQCLFVQRLNEEKVTNIFDEEYALLDGEAGGIKDWYNKSFVTQKLQKEMTAKLSKKGFTKVSQYEANLVEAFILATAKYPNGYGNLQNLLKAFYEEAGLDLNKITGTVCKGLSGKNYDSYLQLQNAVKKLYSDGGGSSGGSSGGSARPVNVEIQGSIPSATTPQTPSSSKGFKDISHVSWAQSAIENLAEKGIINGKGDGKFCPDDMVTREEFTKMVVEAFEIQGNSDVNFSDVSENAWYRTYVERAYAANIIKGMDSENFGTGRNISRQDMAVICLNIVKNKGIAIGGASREVFGDDETISDYAKEAVYTLREMGIIGGMGDNRYEPQGFATRAQAAVILQRLLSR